MRPARWLRIAAVAAFLSSLSAGFGAETSPAPKASQLSRGPQRPRDAIADPLLLLLRAPAIHRELGLSSKQVEALRQAVAEIDEPLWRLRDLQFLKAEHADQAWQCVAKVEARLGDMLRRDQQVRLRQLVVQARGPNALLFPAVIQGLGLSADQADRIAALLEETRQQAQQPRKESGSEGEKSALALRKKAVAVLTEEQKRRWQKLAGPAYDFSRVPRRYGRAPELRGVEEWVNSAPLALGQLRGKVVALHFFTYGCINCIRNLPAYKDWHERFAPQGLVVLGIHTPETEGERKAENVRRKMKELEIGYPVAIDNKKENWTAWANHTWPAVYLLDKDGQVRYWWYGELNWQGAQGERFFREKIAELLAEQSEPAAGAASHPAGPVR